MTLPECPDMDEAEVAMELARDEERGLARDEERGFVRDEERGFVEERGVEKGPGTRAL